MLRCANLAAAGNSGGLDAGQVPNRQQCGEGPLASHCGTTRSHADWQRVTAVCDGRWRQNGRRRRRGSNIAYRPRFACAQMAGSI